MPLLRNFFFYLILLAVLGGCGMIQQQISTEQDAKVAYNMPAAHITTYRFADITALKSILAEHIHHYELGVAFLKKSAKLYNGMEKVQHDKRIAQVEMQINLINARLENLLLLYPDEWENEKVKLNGAYEEMQHLYQLAYDPLI